VCVCHASCVCVFLSSFQCRHFRLPPNHVTLITNDQCFSSNDVTTLIDVIFLHHPSSF
jgi:hypothetical protein